MDRLTRATIALLTLMLLPAASAPAQAQSGRHDAVTLFSDGIPDRSEYIGQNVHRRYRTAEGDRIALSGDDRWITVAVDGPEGRFTLRFEAPPGERLRPGRHVQVGRFPAPGRAGLEVSGEGRGCTNLTGHLELREVRTTPDGTVTGLWATFAQHCSGGIPALLGEVRVGLGAAEGALTTAPTRLRFPATDAGRGSRALPVWVVGASPTGGRVASVRVVGADAGRFAIDADGCTGTAVSGAAACAVQVRFPAAVPGSREAALRVTGDDGAAYDVPLQAHAWGGRTRVVLDSESGDYVGGGRSWRHGAADGDVMVLDGYGSRIGMRVEDDEERVAWTGLFAIAPGRTLAPGRYAPADGDVLSADGPALSVSGAGRGCGYRSGEFTVRAVSFDPGGAPRSASVDFVQRCESASAVLRGTFEFRAGDTTPPAPWMSAAVFPTEQSAPSTPATPALPATGSGTAGPPPTAERAGVAGAPAGPGGSEAGADRGARPSAIDVRTPARASARRGVSVAVASARAGTRVTATLRRGTRRIARAEQVARRDGTLLLRVRARRDALGRLPTRGLTVSLSVRVAEPGHAPRTVVRRLRLVR